jgi:hypothetical protein
MENPATWNRATRVIADALVTAEKHQFDFGFSTARWVYEALEKEGLLIRDAEKKKE